MGRALCIDVGAGTTDILITRPGEALENAFKLVVPAATQVAGRRIAAATARGATVVLRGPVMGGGASTTAMKRHLAAGAGFVATEAAVLTFADDPARARRLGVQVVSDDEAGALLAAAGDDLVEVHTGDLEVEGRTGDLDVEGRTGGGVVEVRTGDLDVQALLAAFACLGVEPGFDAVAVAVQDHGFSPGGSNRVFRFGLWERAVAERRPLGALFYDERTLPLELTRLRAALEAARRLAAGRTGDEEAGGMPARLLVADTGPAALYGALPESHDDAVLVNVGNGHTVCAVAREGRLAGVFEHHTRLLDGPGLVERLRRFLAGGLASDEVRDDGGHGAVLDGPAAADLPLIATGPRRGMLEGSSLPFEFAAPHGDMMLTGCFGLLRALDEQAGLQR